MTKKDQIFNRPGAGNQAFEFNAEVASVFDDMISRSVPLYEEVKRLTAALVQRFAAPGSTVYDLGCSTGTTLIELAPALDSSHVLVGIDNSEPMIDEAKRKARAAGSTERVQFLHADLLTANITEAGAVIMNYTLQFVPISERVAVLRRIREGLLPGGALVLTEKLAHEAEPLQRFFTERYYDFKRSRGYSELEISQKREALENVLVPLSLSQNLQLLEQAGFRHPEVCLKWINFATLCALGEG